MPFITDNELETEVRAWLKLPAGDDLPEGLDAFIPRSNLAAYYEILGALGARGYSVSQISSWVRGEEFNVDIGMYWTFVKHANLAADPTWVDKLDRRAELASVVLTDADGNLIVPEGTGGTVAGGVLDVVGDLRSLCCGGTGAVWARSC